MIKAALENKLNSLKIPGRVISVINNDFCDNYYIKFNDDITLNKIKARRDDISLFFGSIPIEITTDQGTVVIKVFKESRKKLSINPFLNQLGGVHDYEIPLIIGQTEDGDRIFYDLVKMPHLLVGGSTNSGKSVFMHNCIISTILSNKSSIILIDAKRVEFSIYEDIPHLCAPICYAAREIIDVLSSVSNVMESRYKTLKENNVRNIKEYRENGGKMQYITIFIDELADIIMSNRKIEYYLIRLAQLGRACGIHLIVATQRPDATIISGLIRANIPSRVCFAVQKATDSRIILDISGGECLHGAGDGIFLPIGDKTPLRFQAPYISTSELLTLIDKARHCND